MLDGSIQMTIHGILDTTATSFDYDLRNHSKMIPLALQPSDSLVPCTGTPLQNESLDPS